MVNETQKAFQKIDDMLVIHLSEICVQKGIPLIYSNEYEQLASLQEYARQHYREHYSNICWYRECKQESFILGCIMKNKSIYNYIGVTEDTVIKAICCIYNFDSCEKDYAKIPTRYIVRRTETSKSKVESIFYSLSKQLPEIFKIKYTPNGTILLKVNKKQLMEDRYIKLKSEKFRPRDLFFLKYFRKEIGNIYCKKLSKRTLKKKLIEAFIGMSISYTSLTNEYITPDAQLQDQKLYGKREDIQYIELPVHIISKALNIPIHEIVTIMNTLCRSCSYISRHDKVYVDGQFKHYYNENYKDTVHSTKLVDYKQEPEQEGKRLVTQFSYIIHTNEFKKCKISKNISKNIDNYTEMVIRELINYKCEKEHNNASNFYRELSQFTNETVDDILGKNDIFYEDNGYERSYNIEIKDNVKDEYKEVYGMDYEDLYNLEDGKPKFQIKELKSLNKFYGIDVRDKEILTLTKISQIKSDKELCYKMKVLIERIGNETTPSNDFKQYLKMIDIIKEEILKHLSEYRYKENKLEKLKTFIKMYNIESLVGCY